MRKLLIDTRFSPSSLYRSLFLITALLLASVTRAQIDIVEGDTLVESEKQSPFDSIGSISFSPVQMHTIPDTAIQKIRADEDYWYAGYIPVKTVKKKQSTNNKGLFAAGWLNSLLWILVIASLIAIIIWILASSNVQLFRKPSRVVAEGEEELKEVDIFSLDYDDEIKRHIGNSDFRQATRLLYLRTLKDLSNAGLIHFTHERTNHDYLDELRDTAWHRDFFHLTRHFEFTWYGKFEIPPTAFSMVRSDFETFREGLSS